MNKFRHTLFPLFAASPLALAVGSVLAQQAEPAPSEADTYVPLALVSPALDYPGAQAHSRWLQLGLGYTDDDNYRFGEYNGLQQQGPNIIGNLQWQESHGDESYWRASGSDLGLETREGEITWGKRDRMRVSVGFDSQLQARNDSGATPFSGNHELVLPSNWVSDLTTPDFSALPGSLQEFDRELSRDRFYMEAEAKLNDNWHMDSRLSYEDKEGHADTGAAIYIDGASSDAALLRSPVDYATTELDMGLAYSGDKLHLQGRLAYSDFDNNDDLLSWQNPYSSYGPQVQYPQGYGALGLAPDNDQASTRLTGHYLFSGRTRLQFDGSFAVASQDQDYLGYTINPGLVVGEPLPADSFDGEVATSTFNTKLLMQPLAKLSTEVFYKMRDRDYDSDRAGYLYVRGDGEDQPESPWTVYNTNHDLTSQAAGFELAYRLPLRSKLGFEYQYEDVERRNAAVEETEEDRYTLSYRIQPWSQFSAKLQLQYADRAADTYNWDQSYYALLDTELINTTPDNQRYINHPQLYQYYLSNRERWESKVDLSYLPSARWNLNLNLLWRNDDYDQSDLGLTESQWGRAHISASFMASDSVSTSAYAGYDQYQGYQTSREFRGGQEKNAFAIYPPLPQASDPAQNWDVDTTDSSITLGANMQWQVATDWEVKLDYTYVDTQGEQDYSTRPGGTVSASDLPDVDTRLHRIEANGVWHLRDNLSLQLDYRFYSYKTDDWAWDGMQATSINKVLGFGQTNPNEDIHYAGVSAIYRWQ